MKCIQMDMQGFIKQKIYFKLLLLTFLLIGFCLPNLNGQSETDFDIVLKGGRVIDPETGLNDIRNVGIVNGRIVSISSEPMTGREVIDVSGLIVAPGFIDLHVHGMGHTEQLYKIYDGVTSFFELEIGIPFQKAWHRSANGTFLLNYGASASWAFDRTAYISKTQKQYAKFEKRTNEVGWINADLPMATLLSSNYEEVTSNRIYDMLGGLQTALEDGALGIAVPVQYVPKASREEVFRVYQFAGKMNTPIFTHVRPANTMAIQQAISDAVLSDAPLHICHINSIALKEIDLAIEMVQVAQKRGFDVSMEMYPYAASSTNISSALFDEGWQDVQGITYEDLQWVETGERLTKETFQKYRKTGGWVILHKMKPEWIRNGMASDDVMIASDGMPFTPNAHPRTAGTYARVLGKYVREEKVISLTEAIRKMTLLPARRLEGVAPSMRWKGRIQVGCDADITVFDAQTIIDHATFDKGLAYSSGVHHVLVNGVFVLKNEEIVEKVFPGKPVYGKYKK